MSLIKQLKALKKTIKEKNKFFKKNYIKNKGYLPDRVIISGLYKKKYGEKINLKNPTLFSEKTQWIKLYYRDPLFIIMADKYKNRFYIEKITGENYSVPLLGVWKRAEDIDFDALPSRFVLKTNHDSHPIPVLDKESADLEEIRHKLYVKLNISKYLSGREWPYKNMKRCIIAEEFLGDGVHELRDYKFFCFNGKPKYFVVFTESTDGKHGKMNFYDMDCNSLPIRHRKHPPSDKTIELPGNFNKMVALSEKLSKDIPFVRVDMFNVEGKIYVGELTFFPSNGMPLYETKESLELVGSWFDLPNKNGWKKLKRDNKWIKEVLKL